MAGPAASNLTLMLNAANTGDANATDRLLPMVYDELRSLAHQQMAKDAPGQTLQPTALVHEAYLRLAGDPDLTWHSRGHFFAAAAIAMRRILIERARRHHSVKRGGGRKRVAPDEVSIAVEEQSEDFLDLDKALSELEQRDERKARIVMLRYFTGLTIEQTAAALGLSVTTVKDEWSFARAWLHSELTQRDDA